MNEPEYCPHCRKIRHTFRKKNVLAAGTIVIINCVLCKQTIRTYRIPPTEPLAIKEP